jgi:hypothetical protein
LGIESLEDRRVLAAAFFAPAEPSGTVDVQLVPLANVAAGTQETVTFGVPFTRGSVTQSQLSQVRVLKNGVEIPAFVEQLTPWRSIDNPNVDGASVRVARVQVPYTFAALNPETITVQWGGPARSLNRAAMQDPRLEWHTVTSGSFVATDNVEEPDVLPVLPKAYLSKGMFDARTQPTADAAAETRDNPATTDAMSFSAYTELDYAQKNFFYTTINQNPGITIDYKAQAEPWLYDRSSAMYELYLRSGFATALREAVRSTDFYVDHLDAAGFFTLKPGDAKYAYNESLAYTHWLLGDNRTLAPIATVVGAHNGTASRWSPSLNFWTERNAGYKLQANQLAYEVTGNTTFKANIQTIINDLIWHQNGAGGQLPANRVDGGLYHTGRQHDSTEVTDPSVIIASSWMSTLVVDPMVRTYGVWQNSQIADFIVRMGNFEKVASKTDAGGQFGGTTRYPDYLMRADGTSENRTSTDVQHAIDVGAVAAWATYFAELRGTPDASLRQLANDLYTTYDVGVNYWTRPGGTNYNVSPPRRYNWEYKNSASFSWALTSTDGTPPTNAAPAASAGGPYSIIEGEALILSGTGSDPDSDPLTHGWDVNNDGAFTDAAGSSPTITWEQLVALGLADGGSTWQVRVQVSDGVNAAVTSLAATLTLDNQVPAAAVSAATDGFQGVRGQLRTFALSATDVSPVDQLSDFAYRVNWGDGSALETFNGSSSVTVNHVFESAGAYAFTVTAADKDGGESAPLVQSVTIVEAELQGDVLAVGGTTGSDTLTFTPLTATTATLLLNTTNLGTVSIPSGGVVFYGHLGSDTVIANGTAAADAFDVNGSTIALNATPIVGSSVEAWSFKGWDGNDLFTVHPNSAVTIDGGTGIDTIAGPDGTNEWRIKASGGGDLNIGSAAKAVVFTTIESVLAGNDNDAIRFSGTGALTGQLNAGLGSDLLDYSALSGPISINLQTGAATKTGGVSGFEMLLGSGGVDTLTGPSPGVGSVVEWAITGAGAGTVNGLAFSGIENLTGGSNLDRFLLSAGGSVTGVINGGTSGLGERDQLSYALVAGPVTIDLKTKTQPRVGTFTGIEELIGSGASDELRGADLTNTWSLTGTNIGTLGKLRFEGIENLRGGSLNDSFSLAAGVIHGTIEGGLGTDTVLGPNAAATWIINGSGAGSLNAMPISGIENLTGGSGVDTFDIAPGGSLAGLLNGGTGGRNVLSYAQWSAPVSVNLATKVATAIGGQVSNVAVVVGGSGDDQLTGNASLPSVLVGGPGSDTLTGGSGRDILIGGSGADSLTGAAGDDLLIAGRTSFDQNAQALLAILDEWSTTARPYATRVNNLRGIDSGTRLNGSYFLQNEPTDTLESDPGTLDSLIGGLGQDWFITDDPTDTTDQVTSGTTPEQREDATP